MKKDEKNKTRNVRKSQIGLVGADNKNDKKKFQRASLESYKSTLSEKADKMYMILLILTPQKWTPVGWKIIHTHTYTHASPSQSHRPGDVHGK